MYKDEIMGAVKVKTQNAEKQTGAEIVLEALKTDGDALGDAAPTLQADREIVMAAVRKFGRALQYASPDLQGDRDVVMAAVKNCDNVYWPN